MNDKMIFNNIETLKISGNEVQSIITLNGDIIYQKGEDTHEDNDYIFTQNGNVIENYANIYTLSDLNSYFKNNTDILNVKLTLPTATNCGLMFWQCSALTDANLSLPKALASSSMFENCSALTDVDLNLPRVDDCSRMFRGCSALTSIDLSLPYAMSCNNLFNGCSALTDVKLTIKRVNKLSIFDNCPNLETIDITIFIDDVVDNFKSYIDSLNLEHLTSLIINGHQYILYYDSTSIDNTARYTPCVVEGGSPKTIQFKTDKYYFPNSSGRNTAFISSVNVSNNCIIEADLYKLESNGHGLGIGFGKVTASGKANYNGLAIFGDNVSWYGYSNQSWDTSNYWRDRSISENVTNKWIHIKILRNENDVTITFTNTNGDIIFDTTGTVASFVQGEDCYLALFSSSVTGYIKNIKVTEI